MPDAAITLSGVTKRYRLYSGVAERALDVLGLSALRFGGPVRYAEHAALDGIDLDIGHGERVGIVGRNGAGKTTLLKLMAGNFAPTTGVVKVNGRVQALLSMGLGFHPEFTGLDNIRSALVYNGLPDDAIDVAVAEVADFAELGEYLGQPMRTYSQGMQARLMFAAATAIRPDILIVDEVLGAGDAYFNAKSARRMQHLAASGCTLLLVSHSMQQILQFCERAVWLEGGTVAMDGGALAVVKAYEEFVDHLRFTAEREHTNAERLIDSPWFRGEVLERVLQGAPARGGAARNGPVPAVSRWAGEGGLRIRTVRLAGREGDETRSVATGEEMRFEIEYVAERSGTFPCRFVVLLFTEDGRPLSRHMSEPESLELGEGQGGTKTLTYPAVLLGNGNYVFSVAIYRSYEPRDPQAAQRYDLLSRSFAFRVRDAHGADPSVFHHPATWSGGARS